MLAITKMTIWKSVLDVIERSAWMVFAGGATFYFFTGFIFPWSIPVVWPTAYFLAVLTRMVTKKT